MPEKTITVELTEQEGAMVWELVAQKCKAPHSAQIAYQFGVAQEILLKINDAARVAGAGDFAKNEEPGGKESK
jgi:hypothetical protein